MDKSQYFDKLSKQTKQITSKIKKLNKVLPELKYFTEFHIENCDKNNNILLYLKNKYPAEDVYIGYINRHKNFLNNYETHPKHTTCYVCLFNYMCSFIKIPFH